MAIAELQLRRQAFLDFIRNEINRQRLPSPTLSAFQELNGKLLQRIECVGAAMDPSAGAGQVIVQADLVFHHNTLAAVRAAGSLQAPVTEQFRRTLPITIAVAISQGKASVRWSILGGAVPGKDIPFDLGENLTALAGAVEAADNVVAIRVGTRADDAVTAPIVNRLGNGDWMQLVSGPLIADIFFQSFEPAVNDALSDTLQMGTAPAAAWFPAFAGQPPLAACSATVIAVDECIFDMDVPVDLQLVGTLQPSGPSMVTTLRLSWEPDSAACEIVAGLLLTPIASIAIHGLAEAGAAETILGKVKPFEGFHEVARDDESITYQQTTTLETPSPRFVLNRSEVTDEGLITGGILSLQGANRGLIGGVSAPSSGLSRDCHRRQVNVTFTPASVSLSDLGVEGGAPRLFPNGVTFDPPNAWVASPGSSHSWLDLALNFVDPPGGRLAPGTATSVFLHTDCGLRWIDLGVIPVQHPAPTIADIAQMLSQCLALSDPWGEGIMHLDWLVDPPDLSRHIQPVRQWTVAARGLPNGARLDFVAIGRDGSERTLGGVEGRRDVAVHIVTDASETLEIRTGRGLDAPPPVISQRWVVPFASMALEGEVVSMASNGRMIGLRDADGATRIVEIGLDGELQARRVEPHLLGEPALAGVRDALARGEKRRQSRWTVPARVDKETVALTHRGHLLVGRAMPATRM